MARQRSVVRNTNQTIINHKLIILQLRRNKMGRMRSNTSFGNTTPAPKLDFERGWHGLCSRKPTCTDFGIGHKRNVLHPSGYFCSNCKWYENAVMAGQGNRVKHDSQAYACQANHYDWAYPREKWTVVGNHFMPIHKIEKEEERLQK